MSINTIGNEKIKLYFKKALNEVIEGKKLSTSLKKLNFYDKSFIESIALAEESGEMENILKNISEIYLDEYENKTNFLLSLLEPVMMIIIGGIIGFIVTAMLLPIFSMNIGQ
jgi:general secretion pathway protein F/type IV pilus assembly protein PilC